MRRVVNIGNTLGCDMVEEESEKQPDADNFGVGSKDIGGSGGGGGGGGFNTRAARALGEQELSG